MLLSFFVSQVALTVTGLGLISIYLRTHIKQGCVDPQTHHLMHSVDLFM